jgi:alkaline phosphatase
VGLSCARAVTTGGRPKLRFGLLTDPHYADAPPNGTRFYRESVPKMTEAVAKMNAVKVDFLIELGDFKDQRQPPAEDRTLKYLETVETVFGKFKGPRYHVLGNHDMDSISKEQFLSRVENTGIARDRSYYSFDKKGLHVVVLDANFISAGAGYNRGNFDWKDANVPKEELDWLARDLASTSKPSIVFVHQQLDGGGDHLVRNAGEVRRTLEAGGNVLAVFQGHNHAGDYHHIGGIHYYTLKAMIEGSGEENNSYAVVDVLGNNDIVVTGYRKAKSGEMKRE